MRLSPYGSTSKRFSHSAVRGILSIMALVGLAISLIGCSGSSTSGGGPSNVLYTSSNDPTANTIIAYTRASDGSLTPLSGSPYDLKGQGFANPTENIGPADDDQQIISSPDRRLLFAVNSGSNTIAVMRINSDGSLAHVSGSPFNCGGTNPFGLHLLNGKLYCVNKNVASGTAGGSGVPCYTVFNVASDGTLTQNLGATVLSPAGSSAAQILSSANNKVMFTNDFFGPLVGAGTIRSYTIGTDGLLTQVGSALTVPFTAPSGTDPAFVPFYTLTQGVQVHPTQGLFYACAPIPGKIAVYSFDNSGAMSYSGMAQSSGVLPCWIKFNASGSRMYVACTGDNSISVFDNSIPTAPREIQHFVLRNSADYPTHLVVPILPNLTAACAAELSLDPSGSYLYVVSHRNDPDLTHTNVNFVHTLPIAADGTVSEPTAATVLNVSTGAHPHGMLVF